MFEKPTKIKEGKKRGEGRKKFEVLRRTEFYKLFEAGYLIIHLMLHAAVRLYGNTLMHDNSFRRLCVVKRKCVITPGSGNRNSLYC